jgi:hypothetical protein
MEGIASPVVAAMTVKIRVGSRYSPYVTSRERERERERDREKERETERDRER